MLRATNGLSPSAQRMAALSPRARLAAPNPTVRLPAPNPAAELVGLPGDCFDGCRITPDNHISVYDAISNFLGCSVKEATKKFSRLTEGDENLIRGFSYFGFLRADGKQIGRPTPVAPANVIHKILVQLPVCPRVNALRSAAIETHIRALAGDIDLVKAIRARRAQITPEVEELLMTGLKRSREATEAIEDKRTLQVDANDGSA